MIGPIKFKDVEVKHKGKKLISKFISFEVEIEFNKKKDRFYFYIDSGSDGTVLFINSIRFINTKFYLPKDEKTITLLINKIGYFSLNEKMKVGIDRKANLSRPDDKPINCGIIGTDFLKNYLINIDFKQREFYLYKDVKIEHPYSLQFDFNKNFLFIYAKVENRKLKFLFDTGLDLGGKFVLFERGFNKLDKRKYKSNEEETSPGVLGISYKIEMYPQKIQLNFSNELYHLADFAVMKDNPMTNNIACDGIIGNHLFLDRQLSINYIDYNITFSSIIQ